MCASLAIRLSIVSVQSADVERMCKAHNIIHTKNRNRLQHERVKKLLYCYINMRITDGDISDPYDFLITVQDDDDDDDCDNMAVDESGEDEVNIEENGDALLIEDEATH